MSDGIPRRIPRPSLLRPRLLHWFNAHKRDLPWRTEPRNPYHVWLSEVMLQQTRVATVIPYYARWLKRYPTLESLAQSPLEQVLKLWEGLGYYSRARNFHKAAQIVVREHSGVIPSSVEELMRLPGIGRYTAGAITSLSYNTSAPILDGNVKRVLSRLYALEDDGNSRHFIKTLWQLSTAWVATKYAGQVNEALMELGATVCTLRRPDCINCPLRLQCIAYAKGTPEAFPSNPPAKAVPQRVIATAVISDPCQRFLMARRSEQGLLGGLWEFPGGVVETPVAGDHRTPSEGIMGSWLSDYIAHATGLRVEIDPTSFSMSIKHSFTHFTFTRHLARLHAGADAVIGLHSSAYTDIRWVYIAQIQALPLTRSDQKILQIISSENDTNQIS